MAKLLIMNGTNTVGTMQGTATVGMNGGFYSTGDVVPGLNGATNAIDLNGGFYSTGDVVPGLNGVTTGVTLNGVDCCELNPFDIELNGIEDATDEDLDAIRLALMYGDDEVVDAYEGGELNGLKDILAARKARLANETPEQREARIAKRKKIVGAIIGAGALAIPGGAAGGKLATLLKKGLDKTKALRTAAANIETLDAAGIEPDEVTVATRSATQADAGVGADSENTGGVMGWWNRQTTVTKVAVVGGAGLAAFLIYRNFFAKKGKRRK